jgi:hypothetical protein
MKTPQSLERGVFIGGERVNQTTASKPFIYWPSDYLNLELPPKLPPVQSGGISFKLV